jgi:hypothetical protein
MSYLIIYLINKRFASKKKLPKVGGVEGTAKVSRVGGMAEVGRMDEDFNNDDSSDGGLLRWFSIQNN